MENRHQERQAARLMPENLTKVLLVFPGKLELEASVVDISSQGLKVSIPTSGIPLSIPGNSETVEVVFHKIQLHLTCRCIYVMCDTEDSMFMGLYVFDSAEQRRLGELIDVLE